MKISKTTEDKIIQHVMRDLQPTLLNLNIRIGASAILGSAASLLVCGQFGIGLTSWADAFSAHMHQTMPFWLCSIVCGGLFAVFPTLLLRLFSSPMFFHVLFKKHFVRVIAWFASIGSVLALFGHHGNDLAGFSIWASVVFVAVFAIGRILRSSLPSLDLRILTGE